MHSPDRYIFALAMLEGDRSARQVLADMLEEQGERGLAQWARQGRKHRRHTLEFAFMLLPCRPAIGLAAEFIAKGVTGVQGAGKLLVSTAQQWARKEVDTRVAVDSCRTDAANWMHERNNAHFEVDRWERNRRSTCADLLVCAIQLASNAEQLAASGDLARAAARDLESRQSARQIACHTYTIQSDSDWQTAELQQLLKELLASEDDKWPR